MAMRERAIICILPSRQFVRQRNWYPPTLFAISKAQWTQTDTLRAEVGVLAVGAVLSAYAVALASIVNTRPSKRSWCMVPTKPWCLFPPSRLAPAI